MTFPTTPILDTFIRADENPITTNWTTPMFSGEGNMKIVSNQMAPTTNATACAAYYDLATFGPNCEAYVTLATKAADLNHENIYARVTGAGGSPSGYRIRHDSISGTDNIFIQRMDSGSATTLGATITQELASGDAIGIEVIGNVISAYYKPSAGSWTLLGSRTDSTYSGAGHIGLEEGSDLSIRFASFGGGTIVNAVYSANDAPRGFLGRGAGW